MERPEYSLDLYLKLPKIPSAAPMSHLTEFE